MSIKHYLDGLIAGIRTILADGVSVPPQTAVNFISGNGITITADNNLIDERTDVTIDVSAPDFLPPGNVTNDMLSWDGDSWEPVNTITVDGILDNGAALIGGYVAAGVNDGTIAQSGTVRLPNAAAVKWRNAGDTGDVVGITVDASDKVVVGDGTNASSVTFQTAGDFDFQLASTSIANLAAGFGSAALTFNEGLTYSVSQNARTSDAATHDLTLTAQHAYASATGANRASGNLVAYLGTPTNSGTTESAFVVKRGGTQIAAIGGTAGLVGGVLSLSTLVSGSLTTASNQAIAYNSSGTLSLQGDSGFAIYSGTGLLLQAISAVLQLNPGGATGAATNLYGKRQQTTNATATNVTIFTPQQDINYFVVATVHARKDDGSDVAYYRKGALFKRVSGTLTQVGTTEDVGPDIETDATWNCTLETNGTVIRAVVTGAASTTIDWNIQAEVRAST